MKIEVIQPSEWNEMAENAHSAVFGQFRASDMNRFSYVLLGIPDGLDVPVGYIMVREHEKTVAYLPYGGMFPVKKGEGAASELFETGIEFMRNEFKYKTISFLVENRNYKMMKVALNNKFFPIGIKNTKGTIFVEMQREWEE